MNEPFYIRNSVSVTFVAALQFVTPAIFIIITLYFLSAYHGEEFNRYYRALAFLAGILSVLILPIRTNDKPLIVTRLLTIMSQLVLRWIAIVIILIAWSRLTGFSNEYSLTVILLWVLLAPALMVPAMVGLQMWRRNITLSTANVRSAVFAGFTPNSLALAQRLTAHPEMCKHVLGFFDDRSAERLGPMEDYKLLGQLSELTTYVRENKVEVIFVALPIPHLERVVNMLNELHDSTASIYYVPDLFSFDLTQSLAGQILGSPIITLCESPLYGFRGAHKRFTDIILSLTGTLIAAPLMLVLALLIRLTSPGPAIFKQRRYGLDGKEIAVYKFRSMYVTEDGDKLVQASRNDPRITPIGRVLRRFSLDELPQLINVFQGKMSMVGPRPHAIAHNEEYRRLIKGYMLRHKVLPGITGLAQINGCRGETKSLEDMEARVMFDLEYVRNWTPMLDLKILLLTVVKVFNDNDAY